MFVWLVSVEFDQLVGMLVDVFVLLFEWLGLYDYCMQLEWFDVLCDELFVVMLVEVVEEGVLVGKIVVLIGILLNFMCDEVKVMLEVVGVKVLGLVLKKIDYVVVGEEVGSKFVKVEELNVKVLDEVGMFVLLKKLVGDQV